jgi:LPS-assembly protein
MIIRLMSNSQLIFFGSFIHFSHIKVGRGAPVSVAKRLMKMRLTVAFLTFTGLAMILLSTQSFAESLSDNSASRCLPELITPLQKIPAQPSGPIAAQDTPAPQNLEADELTQPSTNTYQLTGAATFKQPGLVVLSDKMLYNKTEKTADFFGNVELHQPQILITAEQAQLDENSQTAILKQTEYQILPSRVYGQSKQIVINQTNENAQLDHASLTACRRQADKSVPWDLKFGELHINNQTRRMVGKNTTLYFKDVPIFYTPYFDYPLDDRASGLLFPEFGNYKSLTQDKSMSYLKLPYFFNIAPNIDDTFTVMPMTQRGLALDNEFRYLGKHGNATHNVVLDVTALQDQLVVEDRLKNRWRTSLNASQNWGKGLTSDVLWHEVSDENFFADIPVNPALNTVTQTERHIQLDYRQGNLHSYAQILNHLRLRDAVPNYEKMPEIGIDYSRQVDHFRMDMQANATEFAMSNIQHSNPEALRVHLQPALEYQLRKPFGSLKSTIVANQTQYQMHENGFNNTGQSSINRFVPQFALKGALMFERQLELFGKHYTQTLEPQVQYLYVPYENQSNLPLFDTANRSLAFSNLFTLNRFTGSDRIGDANQVASALTSKLLNDNGRQIADIGIGQIVYFSDRQVMLTGNTPDRTAVSDIFVKLGLNLPQLYFSSTIQLDPDDYRLTNSNSRLKWQPNQNNTVLLNHLAQNQGTNSETEVISLGGFTRINHEWEVGIYANYDLQNDQLFASNMGLRYDSCCWAAEIVAEHTQLINGLYNDGIQIQFELKGIGTANQSFKNNFARKLNF